MPKTIKAVLFDADGVVVKKDDYFSEIYAKKYGVHLELLSEFFKGDFQDCLVGKKDLKEVLPPYLSKWQWNQTLDDFLHFWFTSENNIDSDIKDVISLLRLKTDMIFLATKNEKYRVEYMKTEMGFDKMFNEIFSSADIGYTKEEIGFWAVVMAKLKDYMPDIAKEEVLLIDDDLDNLKIAKDFGMEIIHHKSGENLLTNLNDFHITSNWE